MVEVVEDTLGMGSDEACEVLDGSQFSITAATRPAGPASCKYGLITAALVCPLNLRGLALPRLTSPAISAATRADA